jgi:hypothetical protein
VAVAPSWTFSTVDHWFTMAKAQSGRCRNRITAFAWPFSSILYVSRGLNTVIRDSATQNVKVQAVFGP